ncbi:MAG: DUF3667 domain-containing protein [Sphingomonadales bacterium]|nr:DUF3667 domain-containing protein [Sphingomonadales bacterium]
MTSGLEAVGDAATGAIVASAVEQAHGEPGGTAHGACLNCGTPLIGHYCHACGQSGHLHRSIGGFLHDILHGVFHFEGKIWNTLPMLFFRPGELTRRYIAGERARFVSPIAMFLREAARMEQRETALKAQIQTQERLRRDTSALNARLDDVQQDLVAVRFAQGVFQGQNGSGQQGQGRLFSGIDTGWKALDNGLMAANENPNLFLYRLQTSAYKYSWLLIPLSTPFVWLLFFWKRQYKFYDHLVFVTFSITFMLLLVTALTALGWIGVPSPVITFAALIIPPVHIYRQVRGAYAGRRRSAILRTGALLVFGMMVLMLYLAILLAMGIMK